MEGTQIACACRRFVRGSRAPWMSTFRRIVSIGLALRRDAISSNARLPWSMRPRASAAGALAALRVVRSTTAASFEYSSETALTLKSKCMRDERSHWRRLSRMSATLSVDVTFTCTSRRRNLAPTRRMMAMSAAVPHPARPFLKRSRRGRLLVPGGRITKECHSTGLPMTQRCMVREVSDSAMFTSNISHAWPWTARKSSTLTRMPSCDSSSSECVVATVALELLAPACDCSRTRFGNGARSPHLLEPHVLHGGFDVGRELRVPSSCAIALGLVPFVLGSRATVDAKGSRLLER